MATWRIYYDDGSTFSDDDGDCFQAPPSGVQIVAMVTPRTKKGHDILWGKDHYYWKDGRWWACDEWGLKDYLMMHRGPKAVLFGRSVRDEKFWDIKDRAVREGVNG